MDLGHPMLLPHLRFQHGPFGPNPSEPDGGEASMTEAIWSPVPSRIEQSALRESLDWLETRTGRTFADHDALRASSVEDLDLSWLSVRTGCHPPQERRSEQRCRERTIIKPAPGIRLLRR
jgi:hypothetical protein